VRFDTDYTRTFGYGAVHWRKGSMARAQAYVGFAPSEKSCRQRRTIRALAGHVSRAILARCSHIRADAKRAAISALEQQENAREPSCSGANRGGAGEL